MSRMGGQPLVMLSDESQRTSGQDAQSMNIRAAKAVASAIRTTLGPKGMDKMLLDSSGEVVVTNDGVTILREMDINHPAANMIVDVAKTQETEVADGTTTAVVVAGELLTKAEELLDQDVHASTVAKGFQRAAAHATEALSELEINIDTGDTQYLEQIAATAMTGKGAEHAKRRLAAIVVEAVQSVADDDGINTDYIDLKQVVGGSMDQSELVNGVIVEKTRTHLDMPLAVEDADVAIVNGALEIKEAEIDTEVNVSNPDELQEFMDEEDRQLRELVDQIADSGADVVLTTKNIDDLVQHLLAKEGIYAARRVDDDEAERVARATGATPIDEVSALTAEHLGHAGQVTEKDVAGDTWLFLEDVENPKAVSLLLRGGTEHVVDEIERAVEDSIGVVKASLTDGVVVPGGGAPEVALSLELRDFADSVGGREQLAVEAFADALEVIPRTLAENAGHDPIDSLVELRATHSRGDGTAGLDAYTGKITDMTKAGVVEPKRVKTQALDAATEAAVMILRIDDVISAGDLESRDEEPAEGAPQDPSEIGMGQATAPAGAPGTML